MTLANEPKIALKNRLYETVKATQSGLVQSAQEAMRAAQESANEQKGTVGDKWESFREQMQIERDRHARQYDEARQVLEVILRIDPEAVKDAASLGAVVVTDSQKFFISASLGAVQAERDTYMAISTQSPLYKSMAGKKKGEGFQFREKKFVILDVF